MKVNVRDLASTCVTRRASRPAFEKLKALNPQAPLTLDLSEVKHLSASFLDGLMLRLREDHLDKGLRFIVRHPSDLAKLKSVARMRKMDLMYMKKEGEKPKLVADER